MSHRRITKCTVCSETGHTRFHCPSICSSCGNDKRECGCEPLKKKKKAAKSVPEAAAAAPVPPAPASPAAPTSSPTNYKRLYKQLLVKFEDVSAAYQTINVSNHTWPHEKRALQAKIAELEDRVKVADEDNEQLTDVISQKQDHIQRLNVKQRHTDELLKGAQEELKKRTVERAADPEEQDVDDQQEPVKSKVGLCDLSFVHARYAKVLDCIREKHCSMRKAIELTDVSRTTLRDFIGIAELKLVDSDCYTSTLTKTIKDNKTSVKSFEVSCRRKLGERKEDTTTMRAESLLLPWKFDG